MVLHFISKIRYTLYFIIFLFVKCYININFQFLFSIEIDLTRWFHNIIIIVLYDYNIKYPIDLMEIHAIKLYCCIGWSSRTQTRFNTFEKNNYNILGTYILRKFANFKSCCSPAVKIYYNFYAFPLIQI